MVKVRTTKKKNSDKREELKQTRQQRKETKDAISSLLRDEEKKTSDGDDEPAPARAPTRRGRPRKTPEPRGPECTSDGDDEPAPARAPIRRGRPRKTPETRGPECQYILRSQSVPTQAARYVNSNNMHDIIKLNKIDTAAGNSRVLNNEYIDPSKISLADISVSAAEDTKTGQIKEPHKGGPRRSKPLAYCLMLKEAHEDEEQLKQTRQERKETKDAISSLLRDEEKKTSDGDDEPAPARAPTRRGRPRKTSEARGPECQYILRSQSVRPQLVRYVYSKNMRDIIKLNKRGMAAANCRALNNEYVDPSNIRVSSAKITETGQVKEPCKAIPHRSKPEAYCLMLKAKARELRIREMKKNSPWKWILKKRLNDIFNVVNRMDISEQKKGDFFKRSAEGALGLNDCSFMEELYMEQRYKEIRREAIHHTKERFPHWKIMEYDSVPDDCLQMFGDGGSGTEDRSGESSFYTNSSEERLRQDEVAFAELQLQNAGLGSVPAFFPGLDSEPVQNTEDLLELAELLDVLPQASGSGQSEAVLDQSRDLNPFFLSPFDDFNGRPSTSGNDHYAAPSKRDTYFEEYGHQGGLYSKVKLNPIPEAEEDYQQLEGFLQGYDAPVLDTEQFFKDMAEDDEAVADFLPYFEEFIGGLGQLPDTNTAFTICGEMMNLVLDKTKEVKRSLNEEVSIFQKEVSKLHESDKHSEEMEDAAVVKNLEDNERKAEDGGEKNGEREESSLGR